LLLIIVIFCALDVSADDSNAVVAAAEADALIVIPKAPEDIAKLYLDSMSKQKFSVVAKLFDADGIKQFHQKLSYFGHGSSSEFGNQLRKAYFSKDATPEDIAKLNDEEFISKWLAFGHGQIAAQLVANLPDPSSENLEFVGSVPEGKERLDVLIRSHYTDIDTKKDLSGVVVITLRKQTDGSWKVEFPGVLLNTAETFAQRISEDNQEANPKH
jgi:hypothetical protein